MPSPERVRFTDAWVESIEPPETGRKSYYDAVSTSLVLIVTSKGAKSYYRAGRPSRVFIGHPAQWSVANARKKCDRIVGEYAAGKDPVAERRAARQAKAEEKTLGEAYAWFIENFSSRHKKSTRDDVKAWGNGLSEWSDRKLRSITREEYIERVNTLSDSPHPSRARHQMSLFNAIVRKVSKLGWIEGNPGAGVPLPKGKKRKRFLTRDEAPRFFEALRQAPRDIRDLLTWCIYTGARKDNVASCEFSEIRGDVWTIPTAKAKEGLEIHIPLMPKLMEIVKRRKRNGSKWLFPMPSCKYGYWRFFDREWYAVRDKAGLADFHIHDLRHTLATWQRICGVPLLTISETLGHGDSKSTEIYAEMELDGVRAAIKLATDALENAASETKSKKSRK